MDSRGYLGIQGIHISASLAQSRFSVVCTVQGMLKYADPPNRIHRSTFGEISSWWIGGIGRVSTIIVAAGSTRREIQLSTRKSKFYNHKNLSRLRRDERNRRVCIII